jgi:prefoldin alpha subunit
LYVPGKLSDLENVIVDIGTGYYVKKVCCYDSGTREQRDDVDIFKESITGTEALRDKGGFHPHQLGNAAGHDTKEAG